MKRIYNNMNVYTFHNKKLIFNHIIINKQLITPSKYKIRIIIKTLFMNACIEINMHRFELFLCAVNIDSILYKMILLFKIEGNFHSCLKD